MTIAVQPMSIQEPAAKPRALRSNRGDRAFFGLLAAVTLFAPLLLVLFAVVLAHGALPSIREFGFSFITSSAWSTRNDAYGALGYLSGTLISSILALAIAAPVGIGIATFLNEVLHSRLRSVLRFIVEILATIPSVVYGLWGVFVMAPFIESYITPPLTRSLGFLPMFAGPVQQKNMVCAVFILSIMILPMIVSVSLESMRMVPISFREAAKGLGATRWEVVRIAVWPAARSGLIGACLLALGRALGETMAVTMVIGNGRNTPVSLLQPADTVASAIANQFSDPPSDLFTSALIEMALLLFFVTLLVNLLARLIVRHLGKKMAATGGAR